MVKAHPFMPGSWQTPTFLKWLRRTHAWLGLAGAVAGVLFSITTLFMEYDDFGLNDEAVPNEVMEFAVPESALASWDDFRVYAREQVGARRSGASPRNFTPSDDPINYQVRFNSPGDAIDVRFQEGDDVAQATRTNRSFIDTLNRLHRAEGGPIGWRILSDAYTGALVVLALTGVLMWSRLHGHRLLGIGLFTGMFAFAMYFMTLTP